MATDLEHQLRQAMNAAVAEAEPRGDVLELVRQRHRRRNLRMLAVSAVALALIATAVPLIGAVRGGPPAHQPARHVRLFPGGGRILLRSHGDLRWLYPDGRTVIIASGYAGATLAGTKLLAWKNVNPPGASTFLPKHCFDPECTRFYGVSYYTMNLDGTHAKLVLPAEPPVGNIGVYHYDVQPSPDGSMLAYLRVEQHRGGATVASELWSLNLATGRRTDLGSYSSAYSGIFVWRDNSSLFVSSAYGRSIELVNARNSGKTTYLSVRDPRVIQAYQRARHQRGVPASIAPDNLNTGPNPRVLAASVADSTNSLFVQVLVEHDRVLAFEPDRNLILSLTWGRDGVFLVHTGEGDDPGSWNTYVGTARSQHLSRAQNVGDPWDAAMFNPKGNAIAFFYANGDVISFAPLTSPACHRTGRCLHVQPKLLFGRGTPLAWAP